jgi:thymidylate synthase
MGDVVIVLRGDSVNELFGLAVQAVLVDGDDVAPRGLPTREVLGITLELTDPRRRLLDVPPIRILNPAFAVAETLWIASGSDDAWIFDFNGQLEQFADDGLLQGAYGRRMRSWSDGESLIDQLQEVVRLLRTDPDTRQAVIQIFDPARDFRGHRDVPCTLNYRFYLRGGRLHMHTTMRSQDLWLGFGYDLFAATVLHEYLARWLGVRLGMYTHHVDSLHLYAPSVQKTAGLPPSLPRGEVISLPDLALEDMERTVAAGLRELGDVDAPPEAWSDAVAVMRSYRAWKAGDEQRAYAFLADTTGDLARALRRWYAHLSDAVT